MANKAIFDRMARRIVQVLAVQASNISPESTALDFDGWDSVTHTYVLLALEEEFDVTLSLEKTLEANNLGALALLIEREINRLGRDRGKT